MDKVIDILLCYTQSKVNKKDEKNNLCVESGSKFEEDFCKQLLKLVTGYEKAREKFNEECDE